MKSHLLLLSFIVTAQVQAACKLPRHEKIIVGCTHKCDFFTRSRLKAAGARLGYKVKIVDLSSGVDLAAVDSVLVPGGADIDPRFYLEQVTPELREYTQNNLHLVKFTPEGKRRDAFEYTLLKKLLSPESASRLPVLGVCRGMQMMSVSQGLPLYLDINTELGIPNREYKFDQINITAAEGLMRALYGEKIFSGLELHHQGIRMDYYEAHKQEFPGITVSATSNDGKIAEAIEFKGKSALGVQYHPEKSLPATTYPVYKWLLTEACELKVSMKDKQ